MLTDTFLHLIAGYTTDSALANHLWLEIFTKYSEPKRYYHTITHLEKLIDNLKEVKTDIKDWETILLAAFYHDVIYKASSSTNEEDSAKLAKQRLTEIGFPAVRITKCIEMIMATKNHKASDDKDTNYFMDVDLAILGYNPEEYYEYTENIRKEYTIYPDFMYNSGRKKIMLQLFQLKDIYKTTYFQAKYEKQARINIKNELETLEN